MVPTPLPQPRFDTMRGVTLLHAPFDPSKGLIQMELNTLLVLKKEV